MIDQPHAGIIIVSTGTCWHTTKEISTMEQLDPIVKIIALTMHFDSKYVSGMLKAGAAAYVLKNGAFKELTSAIKKTLRNQTYLSPKVAHIVDGTDEKHPGSAEKNPSKDLTTREQLMFRLLADGKSSKEIALKINKSPKTVDACRRVVMDKLHVKNIAELVKYAIREGVTSADK